MKFNYFYKSTITSDTDNSQKRQMDPSQNNNSRNYLSITIHTGLSSKTYTWTGNGSSVSSQTSVLSQTFVAAHASVMALISPLYVTSGVILYYTIMNNKDSLENIFKTTWPMSLTATYNYRTNDISNRT